MNITFHQILNDKIKMAEKEGRTGSVAKTVERYNYISFLLLYVTNNIEI